MYFCPLIWITLSDPDLIHIFFFFSDPDVDPIWFFRTPIWSHYYSYSRILTFRSRFGSHISLSDSDLDHISLSDPDLDHNSLSDPNLDQIFSDPDLGRLFFWTPHLFSPFLPYNLPYYMCLPDYLAASGQETVARWPVRHGCGMGRGNVTMRRPRHLPPAAALRSSCGFR